jgi:hypothetical protein
MTTFAYRASAISLAAFILTLATAVVHARDVKLAGMGVRKCSEWMEWKETRNGEARATALEWAQGFIAGHNIYARGASSVVANANVLVPLFDAYCQKHPENRLFLGVIEITHSLGGARINLSPGTPPAPAMPQPKPLQPDKKGEQPS